MSISIKTKKNKRNFHLQKKVGNNVRKLFLTVFLKVGFNKWQECLRLSTQSCGKDRHQSAPGGKRGHTQGKVIRGKSSKGTSFFVKAWVGSRATTGTVQYPGLGQLGQSGRGEGAGAGSQRPELPSRSCAPTDGGPDASTLTSRSSSSPHPPDTPLAEARGQRAMVCLWGY